MEELQAKLMQKTEDLMEMHKKQSEAQGKVAELTGQLRKKEEEISKRDERCRLRLYSQHHLSIGRLLSLLV